MPLQVSSFTPSVLLIARRSASQLISDIGQMNLTDVQKKKCVVIKKTSAPTLIVNYDRLTDQQMDRAGHRAVTLFHMPIFPIKNLDVKKG